MAETQEYNRRQRRAWIIWHVDDGRDHAFGRVDVFEESSVAVDSPIGIPPIGSWDEADCY